jgi:ubiquinone/menaquinone biosynthesis C-methylase UbiE
MTKSKGKNISYKENKEKNHFDEKASVYDKQYGYDDPFTKYKISKKSLEFKKFLDNHFHNKKLKILEIGCGTGEYTKAVAPLVIKSKIYATDISPKSVNLARKKCKGFKNLKFEVKSAYKTGYKNESFDVIVGFYILHHLDLEQVSKEIYRVLRKGGMAFFYEPNILNPYVYLVKSSPALKEKIGDSPEEWAINPLSINKIFSKFNTKYYMSEFVPPIKSFSLQKMKMIDKFSSVLSKFPILKYLGGSVQIHLFKK